MTDKELFEKVEKEFYPEKSLRLERFNKTNFQKVLNEVKGPQAPQANVGGFLSRVAAAIPGTRGYRMRSAEARKQEAIARQEEIKAKQAEKDLKTGGSKTEMDEYVRYVYNRNPQFAAAYDKAKAGKELTAQEQKVFDAGIEEANSLREREDVTKGKKATLKAERKKDIAEIKNLLNRIAPGLSKHLVNNKKLSMYVKFAIGDQISELALVSLAKVVSDHLKNDNDELISFRDAVSKNPKLPSGLRVKFLNLLPREGSKKLTADEIIQKKLQANADNNNRSISQQIAVELELATKFSPGERVQTERGKELEVYGLDKKTGTVKVKEVGVKNPRNLRYFARELLPALALDPDKKKELADKIKQQSQNEENFEQIIKRYR